MFNFSMWGGKPLHQLQTKTFIHMKTRIIQRTQIKRVCTEKGESIEEMLRRIISNNEPIPSVVTPIYTDKNEGVIGDYDIRHDRFDTAYDAQDKWAASERAMSAERAEDETTGEAGESEE